MKPLISVVITSYNYAWCIREAIESVIAQTYPYTEIIVVDDASADDTKGVVESFGSRVKWICNASRTGQPAINRNTGIRAASGEFVAFLDGDDLWEPSKLVVQLAAARQYSTVGLIVADGIQFQHSDGKILKPSLFGKGLSFEPDSEIRVCNLYERLLINMCIDTASQIMVPISVLKEVRGFHPNLPYRRGVGYGEDYEFLLRVSAKFNFAMIPQRLVKWRFRPSSLTSLAQQHDFVWSDISILSRHLSAASDDRRPIVINNLQKKFSQACQIAINEGRSGRRFWATRYLLDVFKLYPAPANAKTILMSLVRAWLPNWIARMRTF